MLSYNYVIYLANYSDGVLYVLAMLFLLALAIIIDRSWSLRSTILRGKSIIRATAEHPALPGGDRSGMTGYQHHHGRIAVVRMRVTAATGRNPGRAHRARN